MGRRFRVGWLYQVGGTGKWGGGGAVVSALDIGGTILISMDSCYGRICNLAVLGNLEKLLVMLRDGRKLIGVLRTWDQVGWASTSFFRHQKFFSISPLSSLPSFIHTVYFPQPRLTNNITNLLLPPASTVYTPSSSSNTISTTISEPPDSTKLSPTCSFLNSSQPRSPIYN